MTYVCYLTLPYLTLPYLTLPYLCVLQIAALMVEADPDGSGDIDFEEFSALLQKQIRAGRGQMVTVVSKTSSIFGFLDPFSWFSSKGEEEAPQEEARRSPVEAFGGGTWSFHRTDFLMSPRSPRPLERLADKHNAFLKADRTLPHDATRLWSA